MPEPEKDSLAKRIERKQRRKEKARAERGKRTFWLGLSMFGLVGWSIAIPTVLLTFVGMWLDSRTNSDISWTLTGLFTGVIIGSVGVWMWLNREGRE
jgi:ATP synthase protein I